MKSCLFIGFFLVIAILAPLTTAQKQADGPVVVSMGDVFERGATKIEDINLATLPSLPQEYVPLNGKVYRITTESVVSGPYRVSFKVSSVTDEESFKNLRILHLEIDEFDPEGLVWIDRTTTEPNGPGSDFSQKMINSYCEDLEPGVYMVARLGPKSNTAADLEVTTKSSPETVQMPAKLGLAVTIRNNGPNVANDVGVFTHLARGEVLSSKFTQGTCKERGAALFCKLGRLAVGGTATIDLEIDPTAEFAGEFGIRTKVAAREADAKPENNQIESSIDVLGDPNVAPEVNLDSPGMEDLFEQGEPVLLKATANDSDGSITKVEFFDMDNSLGVGASTDAKHFTFTANALANGKHILYAVATDNGGRSQTSGTQHIFVNGPIKVRILEPIAKSLIAPGSELTIAAEAIHPSGSIKSVSFLYTHQMLLGEATAIQDNRFEFKLRDARRAIYEIEAVAIDESGLVSRSAPLKFNVSARPKVKIVTPAEGARLLAGKKIEIVLSSEMSGPFGEVELYANGELIDKSPTSESGGRSTLTWEDVKPGKYTLKAVAIDDLGTRGESTVNLVIENRPSNSRRP